jgi:hypothetical protein
LDEKMPKLAAPLTEEQIEGLSPGSGSLTIGDRPFGGDVNDGNSRTWVRRRGMPATSYGVPQDRRAVP